MSSRPPLRPYVLAVAASLWCGSQAVPAPARKPPPDLSGAYRSDDGALSLLEGDAAVIVSYSAAFATGAPGNVHTCECTTLWRRTSPTRLVLEAAGGAAAATIDQRGADLVLSPGPAAWDACCGASWNGDKARRASAHPPRPCRVAHADRELLLPGDPDPRPSGVHAAKGQAIEVVDSVTENVKNQDSHVLVRLESAGQRTVGLLSRADVTCQRR
jgi:hypothetical protein